MIKSVPLPRWSGAAPRSTSQNIITNSRQVMCSVPLPDSFRTTQSPVLLVSVNRPPAPDPCP